ncbi:hypothetical protein [Pararobbsia alpina]|uniref:Uncharacterized protein n=1 Tax=Pararobbsia alpina TaxID=621374 RepID=A0A6S7AZY7_9BURK|nr:hypothetical protein [Pararobbsia alpina]CAB3783172.1 hypothetical protein LMG28138_01586 [Pararobbsia alpina]
MKISVPTSSTGTSHRRATYPDPFDPMRRGTASRPGQRGPVLTRRQRQARDEPAALERMAAVRRAREEAEWVAEVALQGRIREFTPVRLDFPERASRGWPSSLNRTGQVADALVRFFVRSEPGLSSPAHGARLHRSAHEDAMEALMRHVEGHEASLAVDGIWRVSPSDEPASIGERVMFTWTRQRCQAIAQIGHFARGAVWSIGQKIASVFLLPPCEVILDRTGNVSSRAFLKAANETGIELRLMVARQLGRPPVVTASVRDPLAGLAGHTPASLPPPIRTTRFVNAGAMDLGSINLGAGRPGETRGAFFNLWCQLDKILMSPCGSGVQAEIGQTNYSANQEKGLRAAAAARDLAYSFAPIGSALAAAGYAIHVLRKLVSGELPELPSHEQLTWLARHKPGPDGVVQLGRSTRIWMQGKLQCLEASTPDRGLVSDDRASETGVVRMPALPVARTPLGWELIETPDAYRSNIEISDADFANSPDQLVRISSRFGYVRIDGKTYEAQRDLATTRWRIVPPDDAHGVQIAIRPVVGERRWETVTLLGAGDPPPLNERVETRHQSLLAGPESEVYRDAHIEEYDPEQSAELYGDREVPELMLEFAESSGSPGELGQLHQYIQSRRDVDLLELVQEGIARAFAMPDAGLAYMRGLVLPASVRIPGFEQGMDVHQLMELAAGGNLSPFERGAALGRVIERRVVDEMHNVADSIRRAPDRLFMGELRSEQISIPRISRDASHEALLYHFLQGDLTDTQRGALLPLIKAQAERVVAPLEALRLRVMAARADETQGSGLEFRRGYEDFESIDAGGVDSRTELLPAIEIAMHLPTTAQLGAAWRYVQLQEIETRDMLEDVLQTMTRMESDRDEFGRGFNAPADIELPWGGMGTSIEVGVAFHGESVTPAQQGALYRRFLDQSMLDRIERRVAVRSAGADAASVQRGRSHPEQVEIAGLPQTPSLEDIAVQMELPATTPEQVGALYARALEVMGTLRTEHVGAIRRRIFREPRLADYIDGYLNPGEETPPFLAAARSIDDTLDLFRNDMYSAHARGQIARRIARLEEENDAVVTEHLVMTQIYRHAVTTSRTVFSQSIIPSMLKGLLDGQCYAFAATMSVAMHRGTGAVRAFVERIRAFEVLRAPTPPGGEPVERFVLSVESRNVLAALAELSLRQPRAPEAMTGGELTQVANWMNWSGVADFLYEQAFSGHADHLIGTAEHALAVHIEIPSGPVRRPRILFYEPDYGLLEFDSLRDFQHTLERAGTTPFYRERVQGGDPGVDIFRVDPERLSRVRVYGSLTVRDLADSWPFLRTARRPSEEGMEVAQPVPGGEAGIVEEQEPEAWGIEFVVVGGEEQQGSSQGHPEGGSVASEAGHGRAAGAATGAAGGAGGPGIDAGPGIDEGSRMEEGPRIDEGPGIEGEGSARAGEDAPGGVGGQPGGAQRMGPPPAGERGTGGGSGAGSGSETSPREDLQSLIGRLTRRRHVQLEEVHQVAADGGNWAWVRVTNATDAG